MHLQAGDNYDDRAPRVHMIADRNNANASRHRTYVIVWAYNFVSPLEMRPHRRLTNLEHSGAQQPAVVKMRGVNVPRSTLIMRSAYSDFFLRSCSAKSFSSGFAA
eukprot:scpid49038/ scgid28622/ 